MKAQTTAKEENFVNSICFHQEQTKQSLTHVTRDRFSRILPTPTRHGAAVIFSGKNWLTRHL